MLWWQLETSLSDMSEQVVRKFRLINISRSLGLNLCLLNIENDWQNETYSVYIILFDSYTLISHRLTIAFEIKKTFFEFCEPQTVTRRPCSFKLLEPRNVNCLPEIKIECKNTFLKFYKSFFIVRGTS